MCEQLLEAPSLQRCVHQPSFHGSSSFLLDIMKTNVIIHHRAYPYCKSFSESTTLQFFTLIVTTRDTVRLLDRPNRDGPFTPNEVKLQWNIIISSNNLWDFEMYYIILILMNALKGRIPTISPYIRWYYLESLSWWLLFAVVASIVVYCVNQPPRFFLWCHWLYQTFV